MKEAEQEKRNPLLDSIDLDYTSSSCLVDEAADDNNSDGGGAGQNDFLLGDMDLMFDGSQGDSSTAAEANDAGTSDEKKSSTATPSTSTNTSSNSSSNKIKYSNTAQAAEQRGSNSSSTSMFSDEIKMEAKPLSGSSMAVAAAAAIGTGEDSSSSSRPWHSKTGDKQARQAMIGEIARLLKSRKKTEPSEDWIKQLPHKARKLEERLYRSAPSLRAYQDLSTLKTRLLRVARDITKQYNGMKTRHSVSSRGSIRRGSTASMNTALSSLRNSLTSQSQSAYRDSISSQNSNGGTGNMSQMAAFSSSSTTSNSIGSRPSLKALSEDMLSGRNSRNPSGMGSTTVGSQDAVTQPQGINQSQSNDSKSMLEQQKALNEKLRLEIEQNIRTQNELFQKIQAQQTGRPSMLNSGVAPVPAAQLQRQSSQSSTGPMLQRQSSQASTGPMLQRQTSQSSTGPMLQRQTSQSSTGPMLQRQTSQSSTGQLGGTNQLESGQPAGAFNNQLGASSSTAPSPVNPMAMATLQNQLGGQFGAPGASGQGMQGVQHQMQSLQNMPGLQGAQNMQGMGGFQGGNESGIASSNQQNAAARLQMQAMLGQSQQNNGFNAMGNQMQFQGMQGSFNQPQQGQMQQQQQMMNMLRGPQVMPQTTQTNGPAPSAGSMPPPPVQKPGGTDPKGSNPPISPGSFNW